MLPQPGTAEWFQELNKRVTFPAKIAFYYDKKYNAVRTSVVDSKAATTENVRWGIVRPSALYFHSKNTAVLQVIECRDDKHYYDIMIELVDVWVEKEAPASETASETSL